MEECIVGMKVIIYMLGTYDTEGNLLIVEFEKEEIEALRADMDKIVAKCEDKEAYPHFHEFYNETLVDGFIELTKNNR